MFFYCEWCVIRLITRPEESYRLRCVVVCDLETSRMRRPWPALGHRKKKTQIKPKCNYLYIYNKLKNCMNSKYINTISFATVPMIPLRSSPILFSALQYQVLLADSFSTRTHTHTHVLYFVFKFICTLTLQLPILHILTLVLFQRNASRFMLNRFYPAGEDTKIRGLEL